MSCAPMDPFEYIGLPDIFNKNKVKEKPQDKARRAKKSVRFGEIQTQDDCTTTISNATMDPEIEEKPPQKPLTSPQSVQGKQATPNPTFKGDPKSFSQRLFDSTALKILQLVKLPYDPFWWAPWCRRPDEVSHNPINRKSQESPSAQQVNGSAVEPVQLKIQDIEVTEQEVGQVSEPSIENKPVESNRPSIKLAYYSPSVPTLSGLIQRHFFLIPTPPFAYCLPVRRPTALSHFTHENVRALATSVRARRQRSARLEDHFLRCFGRRTSFMRTGSHEKDGKEVDRNLVSVAQSIINIFSNVEPLLRSFKKHEPDFPHNEWKQLTPFTQVVCSMRQLIEIDRSPSNVLSSLWTCLGNLEKSLCTQSPRPNCPAEEHTKVFEISDMNFVHVMRIVLAFLVAKIPTNHIQYLPTFPETSFRITSGFNRKTDAEFSTNILEIRDVFEDEMSLKLLKRLIKIIMIRCVLHAKRHVGSTSDDVLDAWVALHKRDIGYYCNCSSIACRESDEIPIVVTFTNILIEWFRMVLTKEWDGQARLAKGGSAWGAAEILSRLCLYAPSTVRTDL